MSPFQSSSGRRRAFTLVEILVVIAIIAVLVAVLLPALAHARRAGRVAVTLTRLHDLGLGVSAYANDYREKFPALATHEEKAFLGLSVLARAQSTPSQAFINPNTTDTPAAGHSADGRPILADVAGTEITDGTSINSGNIAEVGWHCSFAYDNDVQVRKAFLPVVYMGDRADYVRGITYSANWGQGVGSEKRDGMCALWTDQHAAFITSRTLADQHDPNMFHHNELGGEGADESRDGVSVGAGTVDTHLRFFSEEEDDELLPD